MNMYYVTLLTVLLSVLHVSLAEYDVTTKSGEIIGTVSTYEVSQPGALVVEYLGIPYAQPPKGENRFKPPQTVQSWNQPLDASNHGSACPQDPEGLTAMLDESPTSYETLDRNEEGLIDEDCLYLNIYRPVNKSANEGDTSESNAVMVFFHGGNFVSGTGMMYAGNVLSSLHDVVIVTVNYRLGALGFLSDGGSTLPGNYGLMDQQMALKWIKNNIQAFGGNPDLITIFGSDAGASSAHLHTIIESSSPLFERAIVQSASYNDAVWTKDTARGQYEALLRNLDISLGANDILTQLREVQWNVLQSALPRPWQPVISSLIPRQPREAMMNGTANKGKDILVGSNDLDAYQITTEIDFTQPDWYHDAVNNITNMTSEFNTWTDDDVHRRMIMFSQYYSGFGVDIESLLSTSKTSRDITRIYTDQLYGTWAHEVAMTSTVCSCNVYKYVFKGKPSSVARTERWAKLGAAHGDELVFVFGFSPQDEELSAEIMTMWTEFAKTGPTVHLVCLRARISPAGTQPNFEMTISSLADIGKYPQDLETQFNPHPHPHRRLPANETKSWESFSAYSTSDSCRSTVSIDNSMLPEAVARKDSSDSLNDIPTSRNWEFWSKYYVTLGLSCDAGTGEYGTNSTGPENVCDSGVWSDAGVVMTNDTAGALLITFIVLTAVFLLAFLCSCHRWNKAQRKIRKLLGEDGSSVISNSSTRM